MEPGSLERCECISKGDAACATFYLCYIIKTFASHFWGMRACLVLWCSGQKSIFWIQTKQQHPMLSVFLHLASLARPCFRCGEGGMGPALVAFAAKSHACLFFWESSSRYMRPFEIPSFFIRTIAAPCWESFTFISPYIAIIGVFAFQFLAPKEKSKEALLLQLQQLQEQVGWVW